MTSADPLQLGLALAMGAFFCGFMGAYAAAHKGRSDVEGFLLGFMLGPLGVFLELRVFQDGVPVKHPSRRRRRRRREGERTDNLA